MKIKVLAISTATTLSLALALPFTAHAAPAMPVNGAVVVVTGDARSAAHGGKHYTLSVSSLESIKWIGERAAAPNKTYIGQFTPKEFAGKGWERAAHKKGGEALGALSWTGSGPYAAVRASNARTNASGDLIIDVTSNKALPEKLNNVNLTLYRPAKSVRFPTRWELTYVTQDVEIQAQATDTNAATVLFMDKTKNAECFGWSQSGAKNTKSFVGGQCDELLTTDPSTSTLTAATKESGGQVDLVLNYTANGSVATMKPTVVRWQYFS